MTIYAEDVISKNLGLRPITEFFPNYNFDAKPDEYICPSPMENPFWGKTHTEESKQLMKEYRIGKTLSDVTKQKISESLVGKERSHEWCDNISKSVTGLKKSEEHIANHRKSIIEGGKVAGEKNPMYGKEHTKETREKMSEANKGRFVGEKNPMYGKSATKGKKWYNNGKESGRFLENEQPQGYLKGRLPKRVY